MAECVRVGDSDRVGWLYYGSAQTWPMVTANHLKHCIFLLCSNWACPWRCSIVLHIYMYPNICLCVDGGGLGLIAADYYVVKQSTSSDLWAVINFLVVWMHIVQLGNQRIKMCYQ